MTRYQYHKNIYHELRTLNERIDYKILHGQRYGEDSRRHKDLLRRLRHQPKKSGISRLFTLPLFQ